MREISLNKLKESGVETQSIKDNSVRGITTKYTSEVVVGDIVVLDNHFTLVIDEPNININARLNKF